MSAKKAKRAASKRAPAEQAPPEDALAPLVALARVAQARAHAPYSGFHVGAALRTRSGEVFLGCNVENASYPAGICAERTAIVSMIAAGARDPVALAIVTPGKRGGSPCGICRQTLSEFARDLPIALVGVSEGVEARRDTSLAALLPDAFDFEPEHDPRRRHGSSSEGAQKKRKPKPTGA